MKDLVVLVADKKMEVALRHLLQRHQALGIRAIAVDVFRHPRHDPGVFLEAGNFLSVLSDQYERALVAFDREGCGQEETPADELARRVQEQLDARGWLGRSGVIVLDPELEIWVWSDSPHVAQVLGLKAAAFRELRAKATAPGRVKPDHPKELMARTLRRSRVPWSSALYAALAKNVSFVRCTDPAFLRLRQLLSGWFPPQCDDRDD